MQQLEHVVFKLLVKDTEATGWTTSARDNHVTLAQTPVCSMHVNHFWWCPSDASEESVTADVVVMLALYFVTFFVSLRSLV